MATFNQITKGIVAVFSKTVGKEKALRATNINLQNTAIQKLLDAHLLACTTTKAEYMKGTSVKNEAKGEVKALFETLNKEGYIEKSTAQQYQQCFWIAFETGVPFARDLVNKKAEANASINAKADSAPKNGPVEKTDMPALVLTLQKALHQCTLLNQSMLKASLIDAIVEFIPDFKESAK